MRHKKHMLLLALAIFLLGISGSWASDTNDTVIDTVDEPAIELSNDDIIAADENEDALKVNEQTFGDLNNTINGNSDRDIYLDSDYKYSEADSAFKDGIVIGRDLNVYGNGHTINGSNQARIFKINNGNVVFHNITFTNGNVNDFGGAIMGECTAVNCTFTNNNATGCGGAMAGGSAINCTFTGNTAVNDGGAMDGGSAINCTFTGNTAVNDGGAMAGGSAINCTFTGNTAVHDGGAMYRGSAINCTFTGNTAVYDGGAMYWGSAINCTFTGNTADNGGGAMYGSYYLDCIGPERDYYDCHPLDLWFDVSDFTSTYKSNDDWFGIILNGQKGLIDFINVDVVIYKDGVGEVMRYSCLSGDSLIFDLAIGIYTAELRITYPNLESKAKNIILTINKATPKIEVTVNESTYPNNVVVNVKSDVSGIYEVKVGDKTQNVTLEANISQNITFTGLAANETGYIVNVTHNSENYTGFNDTTILKIKKATLKIEVTANESTYPNLIVNVKTDVSGEYMVTAGDKTQIVTLEANVAKDITFTGLAANETGYIINVTNMDIENCTKAVNDTAKAILHKATTKIAAAGITATYNINKDLVITLTDSNDNPLAGEKITVSLNGKKTYTTDNNGQIKVTTKGLTPKTYTAVITFDGNTNYTKTSKNVKVTVNKAKAKIIAKKKTFKAKKKVKKFTITLKDNKGKGIKNAKVTLKAIKIKKTSKNKTKKTGKKNILKAKTNKKGKATFKINRKSKGKYQVIIKYKGNKYYKSVTKKVKITIK